MVERGWRPNVVRWDWDRVSMSMSVLKFVQYLMSFLRDCVAGAYDQRFQAFLVECVRRLRSWYDYGAGRWLVSARPHTGRRYALIFLIRRDDDFVSLLFGLWSHRRVVLAGYRLQATTPWSAINPNRIMNHLELTITEGPEGPCRSKLFRAGYMFWFPANLRRLYTQDQRMREGI